MHLLTEIGAANLLGISMAAVRRMVRKRTIPHVELPTGDVRFEPAALEAWAREHSRPALPEPPEVLAFNGR